MIGLNHQIIGAVLVRVCFEHLNGASIDSRVMNICTIDGNDSTMQCSNDFPLGTFPVQYQG